MATVRSSMVSRAFHTVPNSPIPSRSTSSKWATFAKAVASRVRSVSLTRLNRPPQLLQPISTSGASMTISTVLWQYGQRTTSPLALPEALVLLLRCTVGAPPVRFTTWLSSSRSVGFASSKSFTGSDEPWSRI